MPARGRRGRSGRGVRARLSAGGRRAAAHRRRCRERGRDARQRERGRHAARRVRGLPRAGRRLCRAGARRRSRRRRRTSGEVGVGAPHGGGDSGRRGARVQGRAHAAFRAGRARGGDGCDGGAVRCSAGCAEPRARAATRRGCDPRGRRASAPMRAGPPIVVGDGAAGAGEAVAAVAGLLGAAVYSASTEAVVGDATAAALRHGRSRGAARAHDAVLAVGTPFLRLAAPTSHPLLAPGTSLVHIGSDPWELAKNHPGARDPRRRAHGDARACHGTERAGGRARARVRADAVLAGPALTPTPLSRSSPACCPRTRSWSTSLSRRFPPWSAGSGFSRARGFAPVAAPSARGCRCPSERLSRLPTGSWSRSLATDPRCTHAARSGRSRTAVLRVIVVILDNGGYGILDHSGRAAGLAPVGTRLDEPASTSPPSPALTASPRTSDDARRGRRRVSRTRSARRPASCMSFSTKEHHDPTELAPQTPTSSPVSPRSTPAPSRTRSTRSGSPGPSSASGRSGPSAASSPAAPARSRRRRGRRAHEPAAHREPR